MRFPRPFNQDSPFTPLLRQRRNAHISCMALPAAKTRCAAGPPSEKVLENCTIRFAFLVAIEVMTPRLDGVVVIAAGYVEYRPIESLACLYLKAEGEGIEARQRLRGQDVVRVLNRLKVQRGLPQMLFCENGAEFTGQLMDAWACRKGVKIDSRRPLKHTSLSHFHSYRIFPGRPCVREPRLAHAICTSPDRANARREAIPTAV